MRLPSHETRFDFVNSLCIPPVTVTTPGSRKFDMVVSGTKRRYPVAPDKDRSTLLCHEMRMPHERSPSLRQVDQACPGAAVIEQLESSTHRSRTSAASRQMGSQRPVGTLGTELEDSPGPDYWLRVEVPQKVGEPTRDWTQRVLVEARAQINKLTAKEECDLVAKQKGRCAICGRRLAKKRHVDLITPLLNGSAFKTKLQIVHPACNYRKHAKDAFVFARDS
jgi:hypothetical protein